MIMTTQFDAVGRCAVRLTKFHALKGLKSVAKLWPEHMETQPKIGLFSRSSKVAAAMLPKTALPEYARTWAWCSHPRR